MKRTFIASSIAAAFALAAASAFAQAPTPAQPVPQAQAERVYGYQLMTAEERMAYQEKMRAAATPEERLKIRDEHRALMDQRAKEKGVTPAEPRGPRHGAGYGPGPGGGRRAGPRGDGPYSQLFTQEERNQHREKMHAAQTPEERETLRDEYRAQAEARAKEKGIALPPPGPRAGGPGPHGDHHGPGAGPGGRGGMQAYDLLTPEERKAFHAQMQAAATPEERAKIRESHHAALEARAKEKGITLPMPGPHAGGPGPHGGHRGPGGPGAGPRGDGVYGQLFTPEERQAFHDRMHAAATPEERAKLRDERRTMAQARAKEKGITLPEWGAPRGPGPRGPGAGPGGPGPLPDVPKTQ